MKWIEFLKAEGRQQQKILAGGDLNLKSFGPRTTTSTLTTWAIVSAYDIVVVRRVVET